MALDLLGINTTYKTTPHYDICVINGAKFAIFHKEIKRKGNINIRLNNYNVIVLSPIQSEKCISIDATSLISLSSLCAWEKTTLALSGKFVALEAKWVTGEDVISAEQGIHVCKAPPPINRVSKILCEFFKGFNQESGSHIGNGLVHTFYALNNQENASLYDAFRFFGVNVVADE